jgi:hypothetical protein
MMTAYEARLVNGLARVIANAEGFIMPHDDGPEVATAVLDYLAGLGLLSPVVQRHGPDHRRGGHPEVHP